MLDDDFESFSVRLLALAPLDPGDGLRCKGSEVASPEAFLIAEPGKRGTERLLTFVALLLDLSAVLRICLV